MEEAEALCSRIGIMVKGKLKCLGTPQHLKNKFGNGYILEVKLRNGTERSWHLLKQDLTKKYRNIKLVESFSDRKIYDIGQISSLSEAFEDLETFKVKHSFEEYSLGQSTLEQVFLKFAKEQRC